MATHSSVLAWRIPGMGKPGGLPSLGSHRVRHNWSDLAAAAAAAAGSGGRNNLPAMQETQVRSLGQEDSPGEGNGNSLLYLDRGAWQGTVYGDAKSQDTTEWLTLSLPYNIHILYTYVLPFYIHCKNHSYETAGSCEELKSTKAFPCLPFLAFRKKSLDS